MKLETEIPFECPDDDLRPHLEKIFTGEYDVPVSLPWGAKILDLGANFGAFFVWATHRWPGCLIEAYEPHPETFKVAELNAKAYPNVTLHNVGVGAPGMRVLLDGLNNPGERSFHRQMNNGLGTGLHAEVIDPLTLPEADCIKLDIEGCEMEVLGPLIEAGRSFALILLEWHNDRLRREVDSLLRDYQLIGSEVQDWRGRGVSKYLNKRYV